MNGTEAGGGLRPWKELIRLRHVKKIYPSRGGAVTALRDVELSVAAGEFVAVTGKSGAGKTTLINMIAGIDRATSGEIEVAGAAIHHLNEDQRAAWRGCSVGIIFQFFQLLPTMTALQNVMLPMDFAHRYSRSQQKERAMALLEQMGIAAHTAKLPSAMSGGQQQRIAIARALANDPPLLLADEPTGSLDSHTAGEMMDIFAGLAAQGKTLLLVTHDNDLARRAERKVVLTDGEILNDKNEPATA